MSPGHGDLLTAARNYKAAFEATSAYGKKMQELDRAGRSDEVDKDEFPRLVAAQDEARIRLFNITQGLQGL